MDEHLELEKKLYDLYSKKEQMASLVDELQLMNAAAQRSMVCNIRKYIDSYAKILPHTFSRIEIRHQYEMYLSNMSVSFPLN